MEEILREVYFACRVQIKGKTSILKYEKNDQVLINYYFKEYNNDNANNNNNNNNNKTK